MSGLIKHDDVIKFIVFQESADHLSLSLAFSPSACVHPHPRHSFAIGWMWEWRRGEVVVCGVGEEGVHAGRVGPCAEVGPHKKHRGLGSRLRLSSPRCGQRRASWSAHSGSSSSSCCWACVSSRETAGMLRWVTNLQFIFIFLTSGNSPLSFRHC